MQTLVQTQELDGGAIGATATCRETMTAVSAAVIHCKKTASGGLFTTSHVGMLRKLLLPFILALQLLQLPILFQFI